VADEESAVTHKETDDAAPKKVNAVALESPTPADSPSVEMVVASEESSTVAANASKHDAELNIEDVEKKETKIESRPVTRSTKANSELFALQTRLAEVEARIAARAPRTSGDGRIEKGATGVPASASSIPSTESTAAGKVNSPRPSEGATEAK
jgi:hypothetical protein